MVAAIILMAGTGHRFGGPTPKQFQELAGEKIYLHTLKKFLDSRLFDEIILVCHPEWMVETEGVKVVMGGATRQESSYLGLLACHPSTKYVVIHDAVRPFVSLEILKENVKHVKEHEAVNTCIPALDTIVHSFNGQTINEIPPRSQYWRGQTPQSFAYELILEAHQKTEKKDASDDCALILEMGYDVFMVRGSEENIKITTEVDLLLAESLLLQKQQHRVSNIPLEQVLNRLEATR